MSEPTIICKATRDTFCRFGIVLLAFFGFGLYFFYDGAIGYRKVNEAICSHEAFAALGEKKAGEMTALQWADMLATGALIPTPEGQPDMATNDSGKLFPLPAGCEATRGYPAEMRDQAAMAASWNDCWKAYSERKRFPLEPGDHPHDEASIREQWYGGSVCMLVSALIIALMLRTSRRELSLRGDTITAAGRQFRIADIERIDLRQWGPGFKGAAYFTVGGRRIKADGMTYGGFSRAQDEPAERFMQAVLARYDGEIIDYAKEDSEQGK